ncbi:hypothetical protein [Curtobacterium sp. 9128]|uniref:hypothetical protein n=1 Tax=Curtobacterium sp. 9128 TaxID=1793722 RepID=UPI00119CE8FD|nr:hypothetical protein [Curtobacterium sp. 9128]
MSISSIRRTRAVLVIGAVTSVLAASLVASPAVAADQAPSAVSDSSWSALDRAIDGSTFDGRTALEAGVDPALVEDFATGWAITGKPTENVDVDVDLVRELGQISARACSGKNRLDYTGIQLNAYLDSCNSSKLLGMVQQAAGVGVIAAAITSWTGVGGLAAGTIAGALAISAGVLQVCSSNGRGIAAHMIPPTAVMWCNNQ